MPLSRHDGSGYEELVELMDHQPDEVGPAVVLADWLQLEGDPRGELIALQLAKETATGAAWEVLEQRTTAHLATHASALVPSVGAARLFWRRGFVHRVEIGLGMTLLAGTLEQWARHPSMRLLRELATADELGANLRPLPVTLRKLELRGQLGPISEVLVSGPALRTLVVVGTTDLEALRHPTLAELMLTAPIYGYSTYEEGGGGGTLSERLAKLDAVALPSLRRLSLEIPAEHHNEAALDEACQGLAKSSVMGGLTQIELVGRLGLAGAEAIARGRAGQPKLEWLRVRDSTSPQLRRELRGLLQPLCRDLLDSTLEKPLRAARPKVEDPQSERRVRNRFKPAWGIGRVIAERDDGIEVEFEAVGVRVVRSPELLVDVIDE